MQKKCCSRGNPEQVCVGDQEIRTGRKWRGQEASEHSASLFASGTSIRTGKNWELSSMILLRRMKIVVTGRGEGGGGHQMDVDSPACSLGPEQEICSTFSAV